MGTAKLTEPLMPREDFPVSGWWRKLLECDTPDDLLVIMKAFRASAPSDFDVRMAHQVHGLLFQLIKNPDRQYLRDELNRRMKPPSESPVMVQSLPLSIPQARTLRLKYGEDIDLWNKFWIWCGQQADHGADEAFIQESEIALKSVCALEEKQVFNNLDRTGQHE